MLYLVTCLYQFIRNARDHAVTLDISEQSIDQVFFSIQNMRIECPNSSSLGSREYIVQHVRRMGIYVINLYVLTS